jgi:aspartate carbamoyltransferase catalytic subunit
MLGAEVAYCAPEEFVPRQENWKGIKSFSQLDEGIKWATVLMALRIQKERHGQQQGIGLSVAAYRDKFRIGGDNLKLFEDKGIILHPGPVNRGIEISSYALNDSRCRILDQVTNGVFVRAALISFILGLEVQK